MVMSSEILSISESMRIKKMYLLKFSEVLVTVVAICKGQKRWMRAKEA